MKLESSVGDEADASEILAYAERNFVRAIKALDTALEQLEAGVVVPPASLKNALSEYRKASNLAFEERKRINEQRRKEGGLVTGDVDLGAAKAEILDKLARLARSGDTKDVSG